MLTRTTVTPAVMSVAIREQFLIPTPTIAIHHVTFAERQEPPLTRTQILAIKLATSVTKSVQ